MIKFRECREAAGISQKAAAIELGVKPPSVSDWESGKSMPTVKNLMAMASLYSVSTDCLLGIEKRNHAMISATTDVGMLTENEKKLIDRYKSCDEEGKETILYTALSEKRRSVAAESTESNVG